MAMQYWPIMGYGLEFDISLFDTEKVFTLMEMEFTHKGDVLLTIDIHGFLEKLQETEKAKGISWAYDGDTYYLMYHALMPWEMNNELAKLTEEQATENLVNLLKAYIKPDVNIDKLAKEIGEIATYGAG